MEAGPRSRRPANRHQVETIVRSVVTVQGPILNDFIFLLFSFLLLFGQSTKFSPSNIDVALLVGRIGMSRQVSLRLIQ